jgi:hypothetical protein
MNIAEIIGLVIGLFFGIVAIIVLIDSIGRDNVA